MQPILSIGIIKLLCNGQRSHRAFFDMIIKQDRIPVRHCIQGGFIILSPWILCICRSKCFSVGFDNIISCCAYTALDDSVIDCILRQLDHRRLTGFQEEYVVVSLVFKRKLLFVLHLLGRILIRYLGGIIQKMLFAFPIPLNGIVNLIRIFQQTVGSAVGAGELFTQHHGTRLNRCQVETHVQIGGACAALHVEHTHGVFGIILEHIIALFVPFKYIIQVLINLFVGSLRVLIFVIVLEGVVQR